MSIATELQDLNDNILDAYTAVQTKGGTVPANKNMVNLPTAINSISGGSGVSIPREVETYTTGGVSYQRVIIPENGERTFSLPDDITALGPYVFAYAFYADRATSAGRNRSLREVDFSNIELIGDHALYCCFYGNSLLESIDLSSVTNISSSGLSEAFLGCASLTGNIDLGNVTYVNRTGLASAFMDATGITSLDLRSVSGTYDEAFKNMCTRCSRLTSVNLSSIDNIGAEAFSYAFSNCSALTSIDLSSATTLQRGSRNFEYMCSGCTSLSTIKLPDISVYSGSYEFYYAFQNCTSLTGTLDLSKITSIGANTLEGAFYGCTGITSVDLSNLETITGSSALRAAFNGCTSLTGTVSFSKLQTTGTSSNYYTMQQAFRGCTSLTEIRFPVLSTTSQAHWSSMLQGCSGVTVHFPAAMRSTMGSWSVVTGGFGGTNTTVLFDL